MTSPVVGVVELRFASGDPITAWESFTLRQNYTDPLGSFSFQVAPPKPKRDSYRDRLVKGETVSVLIDGAKQATAIITGREQNLDRNGYTLSIEAKGMLATAYEASVDPAIAESFQADTPVSDVILSILGDFGFDSIVADATADVEAITGKSLSGRADPVTLTDLKHKDLQAHHGESPYSICSRILSRLGLVLRTNHEGRLLVGSPDYGQNEAYTLTQGKGAGDRMLSDDGIRERDTNDGQHSETIVEGKAPAGEGETSASTPIGGVTVAGVVRPDDIPFGDAGTTQLPAGRHTYAGPWKPRYFKDKKARDVERCESVATLIHGSHARRAYALTCAVDGLISRSGKAVWAVDTVARVLCDAFGISEKMWILETTQMASRKGGQKTRLTLIPLNSLVLGGGS
jgi:prophage tail gpP-like protein